MPMPRTISLSWLNDRPEGCHDQMITASEDERAGTGNRSGPVRLTYLLEWRHAGHRLAYVAAIARAAAETKHRIVLVTTLGVTASEEYDTHLADLAELGLMEVRISDDLCTWRGKLGTLRDVGRERLGVVIPEADALIPLLLCSAFLGWLPRPTIMILMRPPRWRQDGAKSFAKGALKVALISTCRLMRRSFDVHLLDDPLADGVDRAWRAPLSAAALRLDDPCDLFDAAAGTLPPELSEGIGSGEFVAVLGSIDSRKRVPLIIDAWSHSQKPSDARLVIAGRQRPDVVACLREADVAGDPTVIAVDRYLGNAEMGAVLRQAKAIFVLYDGGLSSGLLVTAASAGRWVIALEGSRTGRVAAGRGVAELCSESVASVAGAIESVLRRPELPSPVLLGKSIDFGRRVLRRRTSSAQASLDR